MNQMNQRQLDQKISSFLNDRMMAHPEVKNREVPKMAERTHQRIVSRVKQITTKFNVTSNSKALYQT